MKTKPTIVTKMETLGEIYPQIKWEGALFGQEKDETKLLEWWETYRDELIEIHNAKCMEYGHVANRLPYHMRELEAKNPRLQTGWEECWPPWTADGPPEETELVDVYEDDIEYLRRIGELREWELARLICRQKPDYYNNPFFHSFGNGMPETTKLKDIMRKKTDDD